MEETPMLEQIDDAVVSTLRLVVRNQNSTLSDHDFFNRVLENQLLLLKIAQREYMRREEK